MKVLNTSIILLLLAVLSANSSRLRGRVSNARNRPSQGLSRNPGVGGHRARNPRLFDEFLEMVVSNGEIPDMYKEGNYITQNQTSPRSSLHTLLRNYIRHHHDQNSNRAGQVSNNDTSNSPDGGRTGSTEPTRSLSKRSFDFAELHEELQGVNRSHWSCCQLGQLAGDKGFLCVAEFYELRILSRNANRAHNRRLTANYFRDGGLTTSGERLLRTFSRCVQPQQSSNDFETCCMQTSSEYYNRQRRWAQLSCTVNERRGQCSNAAQ